MARRADRVRLYADHAVQLHAADRDDSCAARRGSEKIIQLVDSAGRINLRSADAAAAGSISLDLFAVLLGGAVALMPIFAETVLHAGPQGLGLLRAMPSLGALAVSLGLLMKPIKRNAGKLMLTCVGIFGVATIVFGLSRTLWVSMVALLLVGASDMVSCRHPIQRAAAGDAARDAGPSERGELAVYRGVERVWRV